LEKTIVKTKKIKIPVEMTEAFFEALESYFATSKLGYDIQDFTEEALREYARKKGVFSD
jgi:hypothetical protein